nr:cleavage and polyadenylation specificity factor subunit 2 [Polyrhizophydium stewartii]
MDHLGAYPYAVRHLGLTCPAYATTPVHDMGQALLHDLVDARTNQEPFELFDGDDVDAAFRKITILRYSQPYGLTGKCHSITITAYSAGHTIGGTIWKIKKDSEDIVYAVDYNNRKERHLNSTVLLSTETLLRPSLLITDVLNAMVQDPAPRKQRDAALIESITSTLGRQGNALIPCDSSTRVLELMYMLDQHWNFKRLSHPLVFLTNQSQNTINLARSMLEWMGDNISQSFASREMPFEFRCVRVISSLRELQALAGPMVVLSSFPGLTTGFARELLYAWAADPRNMIILPDRAQPGTLTRQLMADWLTSAKAAGMSVDHVVQLNRDIPCVFKRRVPLEGAELEQHLEQKRKMEQELETLQHQRQLQRVLEADNDSDMSDVEEEANAQTMQFDIYVKDVSRSSGFFKQTQEFRMFPVHEVRPRIDDYGEIIDIDMFLKMEAQNVPDETAPVAPAQPVEEVLKPAPVVKQEVPSKYTVEEGVLSLRCRLQYIDFEGRSDGKSLKNIVAKLAPRKLILVRGDQASTQHFADFCRDIEGGGSEVYCPAPGECINVSSATNLYQVVLTDALVNSLQTSKLGDYELSYVSGVIRTHETVTGAKRAMLDVQDTEQQKSRLPVVVGDVRLSELRRILQSQGFTTQFVGGGVLVVNGSVVVRRSMVDGSLALEGRMSRDFVRVRSVMYSVQAVL